MSKKSLLDSIDVPAPCSKDWSEMRGDEKSRFCQSCEKTIYNLSETTHREARKILFQPKEKVCVRMEREPDGTIKYLKNQLHQITRRTSIAAGVLSASLSLSTMIHAQDNVIVGTIVPIKSAKNRNKKTSQISFTIYDTQEAVISNADVKLVNQKTRQEFAGKTNDDGIAQFSLLPRGSYEVKVSCLGFKMNSQKVKISKSVEPNIKIILEIGAVTGVIVIDDFEIPIFQLIARKDNAEVEKFITSDFNVNAKNSTGQTALHFAVKSSNLEIVKFLLDKNAKVNVKDKQRRTPLLMIEDEFDEDDTPEIVRLLIAKGANVNAQNKYGQTVLMFACDEENLELVKILLDAGANLNLKDGDGETALDKTDSAEIKNLMVKFGAKKSKK